MNIAKIKQRPEDLVCLSAGECFRCSESNDENIYMVIDMPPTLINKNAASVIPIPEAVFVINVESGRLLVFAKDVVVVKIFATFQYVF